MSKKFTHVSALFAAIALTACGGGGGESPSAPAPAPAPAPAMLSVPLIVSPSPTPGVSVDAEAIAAYNTLNDQRAQCGFGRMNWNAQLETAALGHANWSLINNYTGHYQVSGTPGFTGVLFEDRYAAAGLSNFSGTDLIYELLGTNSKTGFGAAGVRGLLSAPYHLREIVGGYTSVGIAARNATDAGSVHGARVILQINALFSNSTGRQLPSSYAANAVRTYPCAGVTGTPRQLDNEVPNPLPGRNLLTNPIGHPVLIEAVNPSASLIVTSASIVPTSGGSAVALLPSLTASSDPNARMQPYQVILMPNLPLAANTSYTVSVTGTVDGAAFSNSFAWTTGN